MPGLLLGLAQRGRDEVVVLGVAGAAGEGDLGRLGAHRVRALDEHDVLAVVLGAGGRGAEEDEHRRLAAALLRRQEAREPLGRDVLEAHDELVHPRGARHGPRPERRGGLDGTGPAGIRDPADARRSLRRQLVLQELRRLRRGRSRRHRSWGTSARPGTPRTPASSRGTCGGRGR